MKINTLRSCEICGVFESDVSRFYSNNSQFGMNLCGKHYSQLVIKNKHNKNRDGSTSLFCEVCGVTEDNTSQLYSRNNKFEMALCNRHYQQMLIHGKITDEEKKNISLFCEICGVTEDDTNFITNKCKFKMNLCAKHYYQLESHGKILNRTIYDRNNIIKKGKYAEIELYDIDGDIKEYALIDSEDIDLIKDYKWGLSDGYVSNSKFYIHRLIMGNYYDIDKKIIDHINREPLDNRKRNLRVVDNSINAVNAGLRSNNTSGITGVSYSSIHESWCAEIGYQGRSIVLGYRRDKDDAIRLRLLAEIKYYSDYPPQRHLFKEYGISHNEKGCDLNE